MKELNKTYDPKSFEERLYKEWEENGCFSANPNSDKKPFTVMMPPPNVTGKLHMGHAINNTLQDILIRWKRMDGYEALWMPGTDHASISTEAKVVEKIKSEGTSKKELGREAFLEKAWEWTHEYGGNIRQQLRKIGVSCDWEKERFTLDENLSKAVEETFIKYYEKGLIYRGNRIINWCPNCQTALSDAEVDHEEKGGHFWHIKYPIKDSNEFVIIATTRPETMLGDTAVAVHPEDDRYTHLVGKKIILPLMDKEIPIIADSYVEKDFGTGVVKITPAHDPNDFEVGLRHDLEQINIMTKDAHINDLGGKYAGMERYEARKAIIKDLEELGLLDHIEDHTHNVGQCERCGTTVEPIISRQWFVKMKDLAKPALDAYRDGSLNFVPDRFGKVYANWLENIRDWCISRQLWWGHRLPVYYCKDCDNIMVQSEKPNKCKCGSENIFQDPDTLDTWFSSALWPFSTLGWPEETDMLKYFYPTDVLITGYDIIFFWVVRMVFSGIEATGQIPFKDVFMNGLVRDAEGRKMSKSLGNGIDPLDIIDQYGADALRFSLITGNTPGNDMRFYNERVESCRNFANKLWNASRFVLMNIPEDFKAKELNDMELKEEDFWILSELNKVIDQMNHNLDKYEIGLAAKSINDFIWDNYCDWYIEMLKTRLNGDDNVQKEVAQNVLIYVLKQMLKLLHPFMPFITEEIWRHLPENNSTLMLEDWPKVIKEFTNEDAEKSIIRMMEAIKAIRNIRNEMKVIPSKKAKVQIVLKEEEMKNAFERQEIFFKTLASATNIEVYFDKSQINEDSMSAVLTGFEIYLPLEELVDFEKEIERLQKEKMNLEKELERLTIKLSNPKFVEKAPEAVVAKEKEKQVMYKGMMDKVLERIKNIENRK